MSTIKNIFILHQKGLEPLGFLAKEALDDLMDCFPRYKQFFPVTNLGNWKSQDAYMIKDGKFELTPYMSVDWFLEQGKKQAIRDGRWQTERKIDIHKTAEGMCNKISWMMLITKEDLYQSQTGEDAMGTGYFDKVSVLSIKHLLNSQNRMEGGAFQTLVQHEFGHVLGLTNLRRQNTHYAGGPHCLCPDCIMQQQTENNSVGDMTNRRLFRKAHGLPPICLDCISEGQKRLFNVCVEHERKCNPNGPFGPGGPYGPNGGRG